MVYPENYIDVFMRYQHKELTKNQAIQLIGCKEHTFYRMLSELKKMEIRFDIGRNVHKLL
ncbi:MAG TPA: hypothetical protein DCG28_00985 [Lachnospiraceae bacterium]|nr:hypothetical protein [Lachnospiraceae bacterium]